MAHNLYRGLGAVHKLRAHAVEDNGEINAQGSDAHSLSRLPPLHRCCSEIRALRVASVAGRARVQALGAKQGAADRLILTERAMDAVGFLGPTFPGGSRGGHVDGVSASVVDDDSSPLL